MIPFILKIQKIQINLSRQKADECLPEDEGRGRERLQRGIKSLGADGNVCYTDYEDGFAGVCMYVKAH